MLLQCCLLHRDIVLPCLIIFYVYRYVYVMVYICHIYVIYFAIIIFIFITINHIILLIQANLFLGHVCQKFGLSVLLSFSLSF